MKKFISNILVFLLVAVIGGYFVLFAIGIHPYVTISGSMEPTIHTGSLCFVDTRVEFEEIEKGDLVAFTAGEDTYVTHRAISITKDAIETKGDANDVSDGFSTTRQNYVGETIYSIPYLGYAIGYLQQPVGIAVICIIILAIIAFGVIDYIEDRKEAKLKEESETESAE